MILAVNYQPKAMSECLKKYEAEVREQRSAALSSPPPPLPCRSS